MRSSSKQQVSSSSSSGATDASIDSYVASGLRRPPLARLPVGTSAKSRQAAEEKARQEAQKEKKNAKQAREEARGANRESLSQPGSSDEYAPSDDPDRTVDSSAGLGED